MSWVAAVDLGTVTSHLLLSDGTSRMRRTVDTFMGGVSLSTAGRLRSETIGPDALDRIDGTLTEFGRLIETAGATQLRVVATAAARSAANPEALIELVRRRLSVELEILNGADEARLSYVGAATGRASTDQGSLSVVGPMVTIDIGGGSSDFAVGTTAEPDGCCSIPIGGSLLTATYLDSDPPRAEELSAALSVVELHIDDVVRELPTIVPAIDAGTVVGTGAITTVAAVEVGDAGLDPENGDGDGPFHGFELTREAAEDVFRTIATENRVDRACNPGLPGSRVDDIVGGCALLVETMRQLDLDAVVVSQRGLAAGLAEEMSSSRN